MKTKPTPPPATGNDRRALHAYLSDDAHNEWHAVARQYGVSASALLEALASELANMLDTDDPIVKTARTIDADRRRRIR